MGVEIASQGILHSAIGQVLIEESILGWQEHEYEVMRDGSDNAIIVCTMENIDPMGVHTGESIIGRTTADAFGQRSPGAEGCCPEVNQRLNVGWM